jgi:hypothetical protein
MIYIVSSKYLSNLEPGSSGEFSARGQTRANALACHLGAMTATHPFVLKGYAVNTRYSSTERMRIDQTLRAQRFELFKQLSIDESAGDRLLIIYLDIWKVVTFLFFLTTFASFTWAIPAFFRQLQDQPLGLRLIKYVGAAMLALSCVVHLTSQDVPTAARLAGAGLFVLALALFWAAIQVHRRRPPYLAFSPFTPEHIVETGPYRLIRHPFYAADALSTL